MADDDNGTVLLIASHCRLRAQGIPPKYRPWAWMHLSGALEKQRDHMANYYTAMVHMGESTSEFAHQIELVRRADQALLLTASIQTGQYLEPLAISRG